MLICGAGFEMPRLDVDGAPESLPLWSLLRSCSCNASKTANGWFFMLERVCAARLVQVDYLLFTSKMGCYGHCSDVRLSDALKDGAFEGTSR